MARVICAAVNPGLRASERTVGVKDFSGNINYFRVDEDFLTADSGKSFVPVGVVHRNAEKRAVLVELPVEADSGSNRIWIQAADLCDEAVEATA
jgi:hypothetical protein